MKKIIFVRHGKAEDDSTDFTDFERSLTPKGKVVSRAMAGKLRTKEKSIGAIVTSPAFRAFETAMIFADEFGVRTEDVIMKFEIYTGITLKNLSSILSGIKEEEEVVTFFGHNPSISDISNDLASEGSEQLAKSGIACVSFDAGTWSEVGRNKGKLEYFLKPLKHND